MQTVRERLDRTQHGALQLLIIHSDGGTHFRTTTPQQCDKWHTRGLASHKHHGSTVKQGWVRVFFSGGMGEGVAPLADQAGQQRFLPLVVGPPRAAKSWVRF